MPDKRKEKRRCPEIRTAVIFLGGKERCKGQKEDKEFFVRSYALF